MNLEFAIKFIQIFESEVIPIFPSDSNHISDSLLLNKTDFLLKNFQEVDLLFFGYGLKNITQAIDDYEFHLAILSFFSRYGKLYNIVEFKDGEYSIVISISFYSHHTEEIKNLTYNKNISAESDFIHLHLLAGTKEIISNMFDDLIDMNLTTNEIKLFTNKFKIDGEQQNN